jgi:hypothetical protein
MSHQIDMAFYAAQRAWHNATPTDFGSLALAIVCCAWFFTRFYGDR